MRNRHAFTLIELLIVIGIITILMVTIVIVMNPGELLKQSRDSNRLQDMASMDTSLRLAQIDALSFGSANTIYVSIPDPTATSTLGDQCQGLGLPTLPSSYTYHCAASSTSQMTNGTGWIPVNLTQVSAGNPLSQLPKDPLNASSSRNWYAYATDGTKYELTTALESSKYKAGGQQDVITNDGGTLASVYEKGTNLTLEPLDYGDTSLVGYWKLNKYTSGSIANNQTDGMEDSSGNNNSGTAKNANGTGMAWTTGTNGGAVSFDGTDDYVTVPDSNSLELAQWTVSLWIKFNSTVGNQRLFSKNGVGNSANYYLWRNDGATLLYYGFGYGSGKVEDSFGPNFILGQWYNIVFIYDGAVENVYFNAVAKRTKSTTATPYISTGQLDIGYSTVSGGDHFNGIIDDVRIYNRALSAAEITAMYNGGK